MQTVQSLLLSGKGRNGKSLVVVKAFEHGLKLPGTASNFATVPDSVPLSLLSDASIRVRFSLADVTPTNNYLIVRKWTAATSGYTLYIATDGKPRLAWVTSGPAARDDTSSAIWPFAVDEVGWLWATLDANNGSGARVTTFYTASEIDPAPGDWDLLSTLTTGGGATSIVDGSEALEIGNTTGIGVSRIYRVSISNNITDHEAGLVFEKDFTREPIGGIRNPAVVEDSVNRARIVIGGTAWEWETNPALPVDEYALAPAQVATADIARIVGQDATGSSATSSVSAVYASTPTAGDLLVACVSGKSGSPSTIPGWLQAVEQSTSNSATILYKIADGTESTTVTASCAGATAMTIAIFEYSGIAASAFDTFAVANNVATVTSLAIGPTATLAQADELVIAMIALGNTFSNPGWTDGFTERATVSVTNSGLLCADKIVSETTAPSTTGSWVTSRAPDGCIATFKAGVFRARPAYWYDEASSEWVPGLTVPPPPLPDLITYVQHALSTNEAVTLPGTATLGNLLLAGYSRLSGTGPSTPAGWTALDNEISGSAVGVWWYFKWSDGTETAVDFNLTGSTPGSWIVEVNGAGGDPVAADWASAVGSAVTVLSTGEPSTASEDGGYSIAYRRTAGAPGGAEVVDNDYTELDVTGQHHLAEKSYVGVDTIAAEFSWTTARNAVAVTIYVPPA